MPGLHSALVQALRLVPEQGSERDLALVLAQVPERDLAQERVPVRVLDSVLG